MYYQFTNYMLLSCQFVITLIFSILQNIPPELLVGSMAKMFEIYTNNLDCFFPY